MKKLLLILLICPLLVNAQYLSLDELLNVSKTKPSLITDMLMNKGWTLFNSDKKINDEKKLISEIIIWRYVDKNGNILGQLEYAKELNQELDKEKAIGKYYIDFHYSFVTLQFYNKIKESISLKGWKLTQDESTSGKEITAATFKTYDSPLYMVSLAVTVMNEQQIYFLRTHSKIGLNE